VEHDTNSDLGIAELDMTVESPIPLKDVGDGEFPSYLNADSLLKVY
jgi:hypothetical protein